MSTSPFEAELLITVHFCPQSVMALSAVQTIVGRIPPVCMSMLRNAVVCVAG
jgi:hypothetical protein